MSNGNQATFERPLRNVTNVVDGQLRPPSPVPGAPYCSTDPQPTSQIAMSQIPTSQVGAPGGFSVTQPSSLPIVTSQAELTSTLLVGVSAESAALGSSTSELNSQQYLPMQSQHTVVNVHPNIEVGEGPDNFGSHLSASSVTRRSAVNSPGSLPEYGREIMEHFLVRERIMMRNPLYLNNQPEVTERMRSILLDWMVDVHIKFKLHPETYFLAVDIIDRYLSLQQTTRGRLQLVGVVATLIAAKHEEIWPPEVKDCVYIAANTYTKEEILECERELSSCLAFRFAVPTSYPVMSYLLDAIDATPRVKWTALMYLESSAMDYGSLGFLPSMNACAAILLAHVTTTPPEDRSAALVWPSLLEQITRVDYTAVFPAAIQMLRGASTLYGSNSRYLASQRKFSSSRYGEVAKQPLPTELPAPLQAE